MTRDPINRQILSETLERFGTSIESFDALRADSYEQALAAHSLEQLELLYTVITAPGITLEVAVDQCPAWPQGSKLAGRPPSLGTIAKIAERLRTEGTLNSLGRVSEFMEKIQRRAKALPIGEQSSVVDALINCVGEELIQAKLGGGSVAANLDPLDRLIT